MKGVKINLPNFPAGIMLSDEYPLDEFTSEALEELEGVDRGTFFGHFVSGINLVEGEVIVTLRSPGSVPNLKYIKKPFTDADLQL